MIKVSAPTIELALLEAGKKLGCQCIDLEYEIVEKPSGGFLGFGKRDAVIVASVKKGAESNKENSSLRDFAKQNCGNPKDLRAERSNQPPIEKTQALQGGLPRSPALARNDDSFLDSKDFAESSALISQIQSELNALFSLLPIELNTIEVSLRDKNTISIYFTGKDAALLIGEKGYRYKALSYLLYNWLNTAYGLNMRLEIESFLANQEAMISAYLAPIIEMLKTSNEPFTTKPFDGILAYIALKELRAKLKGKNITLQNSSDDEACILIAPLKSAH